MDKKKLDSTGTKLMREASGPFFTLGVAAAIELLSRTTFKIPNPPAFLLLMVVFSAFRGGLRAGLISAAIAWVYFAYYFSIPLQPFHYTVENLRRVAVWLVTTPAIALMVGVQRRHIERMGEARSELSFRESLRRHAERLKILHETDQAILAAQVPEAIAAAALRGIWQLIPYRRASVSLFDFGAQEVMVLATHAARHNPVASGTRIPLDALGDINRMLEVLRQGKVLKLDLRSLSAPSPVVHALVAEGMHDLSVLPLIAQGQLIGSLSLSKDSQEALTPEHIEIAREVADQLAVAIQQARLHKELREQAADLERSVASRTTELREAKTFLEQLIASSPGVIFRRNETDFTVTYVSANVSPLLGYAPEEIVGVPDFWPARVHPDDRDRFLEEGAQALRERRPQLEREYRFRHKDGTYRWLHTVVRFDYHGGQAPLTVTGYALDSTARRQAEDELRRLQAFLNSIIENVPNMIFVKDAADLRFVLFNKAGEELLGRPRDVLIGKNDYDFFPQQEADLFTARDREVLEGQRVLDVPEEPIHTRNKGVRILHTKKVPILDEAGRPRYLLGISEDITEQRKANELIRQAREEAERANLAKSEFLSRMSHELRTPLNAILGFAQLLEMGDLDSKQRGHVEYILKGGRHLLDLINEVLDIARIESGRLPLSPEPVRVRDVLQEAVDLIQPLASARHCRLDHDPAQYGDRYVLADRQRLKQVLLNIVSNAVKYNRPEGTVRLTCEDGPGGRLRIKVADTGTGIPPEKMHQLFTPFTRLGADQGVEGTGLGLALSKRLVEAMDGEIGADSVVDKGSTFWIDLALAEAPSAQMSSLAAERSAMATDEVGGDRTVLYIEDNLSNVKLIEDLLTLRPRIRLLTALQGRLGLDLAREHHPDLILLDLHLPDMTGLEVLQELKAQPATSDIPVVVISADATRRQMGALASAGCHAYLTKPLNVRELLAVLDETHAASEPSHAG